MVARRVFGWLVAVLGFALCFPATASAQTEELQRELELRLRQLRQGAQPKEPKAVPAPLANPQQSTPAAMPEGAIAKLGNSRLRHAAQPLCVAFSPDGKRMFSGGEDGMLRVWDTASGEAVCTLPFPGETLRQIRFTHGGTRLAVLAANNRVHFLHPETLKEIGQFAAEFGNDIVVSDDSGFIAHFAQSGLLRVTELDTGLEKLEVEAGPTYRFHPNNRSIAVADPNGKVTLYMLAGGKPILTFDNGIVVNGLAFSPDGNRIACGAGNVAKVWDISDAKAVKLVAEIKDAGRVRGWLAGNKLAAGDASTAGVYDIGKQTWSKRVPAINGEWAISADGTRYASTSSGGLRVRLWDLTTGKQMHAEYDTFPQVALLSLTPDGETVFVLAEDTAFLWPVNKSKVMEVGRLPGKVSVAAIGKDRLAVAVPTGVLIYDNFDHTTPLPEKPSRTILEHAVSCRSIAISPDGKRVAYSGEDAKTVIADAATGKTLRILSTQTIGLALAFSPDGSKLAVIGRDGFLRLCAVNPGEGDDTADIWKTRIQRGQRGTVAFSPDGKLLAASSSGLMKVVNTADGSEVFTLGNLFDNGLFQQVAFSADGRLLIAASEGMTGGVRVWEVATQSLVRRFTTGFGTVYRMGVFADGSRVVSAGVEEALTLWDMSGRHAKDSPKADELLTAWVNLDSQDAAKGYSAVWTLTAGGARSVQVISAGLGEMAESRVKIEKCVKNLASEEFEEREAATKELLAFGIRALPAVQAAAAKSESAEARMRAGDIITKLGAQGVRIPDHGLAGDGMRLFRAVRVLESIATPEAVLLLRRIAEMGGQPAEAAKAALSRLPKR